MNTVWNLGNSSATRETQFSSVYIHHFTNVVYEHCLEPRELIQLTRETHFRSVCVHRFNSVVYEHGLEHLCSQAPFTTACL